MNGAAVPVGSAPRRATFGAATLRIFELSFAEMLRARRSLALALLAAAPVLLAIAVRAIVALPATSFRFEARGINGPEIFGLVIWMLYVRFLVPILGVFQGTALIADEVEDRTITYLFTRPIRHGAVLLGKYLAYLACTNLLLLPSLVLTFFLLIPSSGDLGRSFPSLLSDLGAIVGGLAAYGAVFALIGARFKRPLVVGLVFALGWEPGALMFPGYLKHLTLAYYLRGLIPHAAPPEEGVNALLQLFTETPDPFTSVLGLTLATAASLWLAIRTVESREYVLEQ